jgi:hypothetical protein
MLIMAGGGNGTPLDYRGAGALDTRWVLNGNAVPQGRVLTMVRRGVRARQG